MSSQKVSMQTIVLDRGSTRVERFAQLHAENVSTVKRVRQSIDRAKRNTLWISYEQTLTTALLRSIDPPTKSLGRAVLVHRLLPENLPVLRDCFQRVAFRLEGGFLPPEQLGAALSAEIKDDLFIGGTVDEASQKITLWRGDLSSLTVPFAAFPASSDGVRPDFSAFRPADYGHTIRLGEYEAATDAVLYEHDPSYRRRVARERRASEKSFGASLQRLRKQRGLRRRDFSPLCEKTIARVEQGKVKRVHPRTLTTIARTLSIAPDEIESF